MIVEIEGINKAPAERRVLRYWPLGTKNQEESF
jgi:hypothetical protein